MKRRPPSRKPQVSGVATLAPSGPGFVGPGPLDASGWHIEQVATGEAVVKGAIVASVD